MEQGKASFALSEKTSRVVISSVFKRWCQQKYLLILLK